LFITASVALNFTALAAIEHQFASLAVNGEPHP
jgi:hypothetical protein